ncbi:MAG TPA: cytochrome P450 [Blastocatellia bacterium]
MVQTATDIAPPGPVSRMPGGSLILFRRNPIRFLMDAARDYGDIARIKIGPQEIFLVNNPDDIRDILVTNSRNFVKSRGLEVAKRFLGEGLLTSEGDFHRRQRRLIQPAFHKQRVEAYAKVMTDCALRMSDRWRDGENLDMAGEMNRVTLAIVAKTLFDADVESEASEIRGALTGIMHTFSFTLTLPFAEVIERVLVLPRRRFFKARAKLDSVLYRIINERRASGKDHGDLLSMLLTAQDEDGTGGMTDLQVRDEAMTLFLAGHETTANAMTWTWYLLSQHPDVEARLHAELASVLGGRTPSVEDVPKLKYTEMVFAESMRLYPPAWTLGRRVLASYKIGDYTFPPGSIVLMSPFVMQHDARFFPDPYRFDPERWQPQARESRPKFSYFPFGGGPRVCIGEQFAWMEGILLLATFGQKWQMRLQPGHPVVPQPLITLRPKHGMKMIFQKRSEG